MKFSFWKAIGLNLLYVVLTAIILLGVHFSGIGESTAWNQMLLMALAPLIPFNIYIFTRYEGSTKFLANVYKSGNLLNLELHVYNNFQQDIEIHEVVIYYYLNKNNKMYTIPSKQGDTLKYEFEAHQTNAEENNPKMYVRVFFCRKGTGKKKYKKLFIKLK